jgi:hypothetical protein
MFAIAAPSKLPERYHPRVEANVLVQVLLEGRAILAKARDLSMAGVYLAGFTTSRERLTVAIMLPDEKEVVAQARVKRRVGEGVALEFLDLDWDDLFALARYLHPRLP